MLASVDGLEYARPNLAAARYRGFCGQGDERFTFKNSARLGIYNIDNV